MQAAQERPAWIDRLSQALVQAKICLPDLIPGLGVDSGETMQAGLKAESSATAPARRAGSASIASRSATADSASVKAETAILGDTNGPEVPIW